jgi:acetylornithine/LysW-gamma-L-lysine aminotransferase
MNVEKIIEKEDNIMANIYWKRPLIITKGHGAILTDANGRDYIDCTGNYGVAIVGYCHPKVVKAIKNQAERLTSCHGTFYNEARTEFLERLLTITPNQLNRVFLSNSGAESVEFAFKLVRKNTGKKEIIAMMGGFHGKTMGALSATWNKKYRIPFEPLVPGFKHVPFGNIEAIENSITDQTAAIIIEPIQGESGINLPPKDFIPSLRELCYDRDILLIMDEIQTGLGRTGKMFAFKHWKVEPDILCLSKAIAGGIPMGVTIARDEIMSSMKIGDHSSTFGGNPIACAAAKATLDVIIEEKLPEKAAKKGCYLMGKLENIVNKYRIVREARGMGLMMGLELRFDILKILLGSIDRGVLFLDAGRNIVRMLPPLVIQKTQLTEAISILDEVLGEEETARLRT